MGRAGVGDIEPGFVRRERQPVGLHPVGRDARDGTGAAVDPIDVGGADLGGALLPFIVAVDAVSRIGEPDRIVRFDHDVVGRIQSVALEGIRQHGDRAIVLGSGRASPSTSQGWRTFLRNHAPEIAAMDFFVVPTIGFDLLYAFVIVRLDRRDLIWINVTANPTAEWVARQITEAFPWDEAPHFLIRDRDRINGSVVTRRLRAMGIRDKPTAPGSPWQNGFAERLIGSIRRECLDHMVVFGEAHLRRILRSCARYYNDLNRPRSLAVSITITPVFSFRYTQPFLPWANHFRFPSERPISEPVRLFQSCHLRKSVIRTTLDPGAGRFAGADRKPANLGGLPNVSVDGPSGTCRHRTVGPACLPPR
jgi:hypothetical protein